MAAAADRDGSRRDLSGSSASRGVPNARDGDAGDRDACTGARLETARRWLDSGGSVLVHGPSGECTSRALDEVTGGRSADRVLACRVEPADRDRRYAILHGLLQSAAQADPDPVRMAGHGVLTTVLAGEGDRLSPEVVSIAMLELLRQLAERRPVLLRLDDIQNIDSATADVLRYVTGPLRRLPVHMAATERTPGEEGPRHRYLCPSPLLVIRVPTSG